MELTTVWFILIAILWTGYLCLEGFDFGVGMLWPILGKDEKRKRVLLNTIGPVWDGNEVWLLTAGGATFAAFPNWYATLFSGFYIALLLILVALIVRNLGFDYRGKRDSDTWRRNWDWAIMFGSYAPAVLWGVALTNIVWGVPIDETGHFTGTLFTLLGPVPLLGGLTTLALFLTHGAFFVALKTDGPIRVEARRFATKVGVVAAGLGVLLLVLVNVRAGSVASWVAAVLAALCLVAALGANLQDKEGYAFGGTFACVAFVVASYFLALWPNVMPSTTDPAYSLTVTDAASSHYTLTVMTIVAAIFTPIVLLYQGWTYWVFRKRITVDHIPAADSGEPATGDTAEPGSTADAEQSQSSVAQTTKPTTTTDHD